MSLEKEYIQVNTSFHPSTKQAKQYIHDVETSYICKGQGTENKNTTMSSGGPQTRNRVFGFGGWVKGKDMRGDTSSNTELLSKLASTQEEINLWMRKTNPWIIACLP